MKKITYEDALVGCAIFVLLVALVLMSVLLFISNMKPFFILIGSTIVFFLISWIIKTVWNKFVDWKTNEY